MWLAAAAFGHGGEDHGAGAPPVARVVSARVPTWSSEYDAVVVLDGVHPGEPGRGRLLVADAGTSAPVAAGSATLTFAGPASLEVAVPAGDAPGIWPFDVTFPAEGPWSGGLVVLADRSDALGLPEFHVRDHAAEGGPAARSRAWAAAWCGVPLGLGLGLGLGWLLGRRGAAAVIGAVAVGLGGAGADAHVDDLLVLPLDGQFLLELRTARVAPGPFAESVRALGTTVARPGGSAEIHAPVTGSVEFPAGHALVPGELVRAGDVLATISEAMTGADRSAYVEARAAAKVRLAEARKSLALAERDLERMGAIGGVLSDRDRLERTRAVGVAREEVTQAEAAAGALDASRPQTVLRSPLTGRVSALLARPGDVVSPADVLLRVTDAGGLWVEAAVPETWAGRLAIGSPAVLVSDAHRDQPLAATVLDPGLEADPASGSLRVVLAVAEPVDWLVPGMSVTASITAGEPREALTVPDSAIVDGAGETLVFVKVEPERFAVRPVRVGARSGDRREVLVGLAPGERVVVQGTYALRSLAGR